MSESLRVLLGEQPTASVAVFLANLNLAGSFAILAMAAARPAARRILGPRAVCHLWALVPLSALAFAFARHVQTAYDGPSPAVAAWSGLAPMLLAWLAGAFVTAGVFLSCQALFMRTVRKGLAGPAVVGLISPRIVMPADDGRYSRDERQLIRAHEREHVASKDPRAAAWAALFQCLCWFNPLVHLAARMLRLDQELACDAAVIRNRPTDRALYARTLLKTQLASAPLPFGCHWPAPSAHPLEVRVAALKRPRGKPGSPGRAVVFAAAEAIRP